MAGLVDQPDPEARLRHGHQEEVAAAIVAARMRGNAFHLLELAALSRGAAQQVMQLAFAMMLEIVLVPGKPDLVAR